MMAEALGAGARRATVLDDDYPPTMRIIFTLLPFLLYSGELRHDDALASGRSDLFQPAMRSGLCSAHKNNRVVRVRRSWGRI